MMPQNPCKDQVLAIEPAARAVSRGMNGVYIEAYGEVIASGFTPYAAWAKALAALRGRATEAA